MTGDNLQPVTLVGGEVVHAHTAERCIVQPCPIHAPSDHHMVEWPQHWRGDRGIVERFCIHGVGHPDPDCIDGFGAGVHGCDGCCTERPDDV